MAAYLVPIAIEFGYSGIFPMVGGGRAVYATGPREIRFTLASDDGAKGTVTIPLEEADADRTINEVVEHATARAKALVEEAI